ncbi:MAG: 7TMR-DISMED2 domain-containing protein [Flammeovirgaceae bacterium]
MLILGSIPLSYGQVVLSDDLKEVDVIPKLEVFKDSSLLLSFKDVKEGDFFKPNNGAIYLEYHERAILWLRIIVKNECLENETFLLDTRNATINDIRFFEPQSDHTYKEFQTGDAFPYHYREVETRGFTFTLNIKEGETKVYYVRIDSEGDAINLPLKIWQPIEFLNKTANEKYVFGLYYGSIIFIIIFGMKLKSIIGLVFIMKL